MKECLEDLLHACKKYLYIHQQAEILFEIGTIYDFKRN